jgi:hypothetical protein
MFSRNQPVYLANHISELTKYVLPSSRVTGECFGLFSGIEPGSLRARAPLAMWAIHISSSSSTCRASISKVFAACSRSLGLTIRNRWPSDETS